mgnify:CR=1 FL=1
MIEFPDPRQTDENGLLAVGGDLTTENLLSAYTKGIFPWPQEGFPILWFSPEERGILDFDDFHIPKSVDKELRKKEFRITVNEGFDRVIENCSKIPRSEQDGTWILPEMLEAYKKLNQEGHAHSVECWREKDLVGGLYGVYIKGIFSGESMFYKESGASKACLIYLVDHLKSLGNTWMDIQMVTPVLELFGGDYISRDEFLKRLEASQKTLNFLPR